MPQMLAVGTIAGIFLCLLIVVVLVSRRRYLQDPQKFDSWRGLPIIASIPHSENHAALLAFEAPDDLALEGIQSLRTAIDLMTPGVQGAQQGITIAMTGVAEDVGTAFVSANLAAAMSASGQRVLLVDANTQAGNLHQWLEVEPEPGLHELLCETSELEQAVRRDVRPHFSFLPRGGSTGDALTDARFITIAGECRASFDVIIFATGPMAEKSDAVAIASQCSLVFLVARSGRHTQATLDEVIRKMEVDRVSASGLIFNDQAMAADDYRAPIP